MSRQPTAPHQSSFASSNRRRGSLVQPIEVGLGSIERSQPSISGQESVGSIVRLEDPPLPAYLSAAPEERGARSAAVHAILNPTEDQAQLTYQFGHPRQQESQVLAASPAPSLGATFGHVETAGRREGAQVETGLEFSRSGLSRTLRPRSSGPRPASPATLGSPMMTRSQHASSLFTSGPSVNLGNQRTSREAPSSAPQPASPRRSSEFSATRFRRPSVGTVGSIRGPRSSTSSMASYTSTYAQPRPLSSPRRGGKSTGSSHPQNFQSTGSQVLQTMSPTDVNQPFSSVVERSTATSVSRAPQGAYKLMTMETEQGLVSFPVDVQAASRGADEKRRRNAGASARFRARRKEKEQQNTKEIDDLKQQISDLGEDAVFYRRERDFLVAVLYNSPDRDRHFPRPPSPRQLRARQHATGTGTAIDSTESHARYQEQGGRGDNGRLTRRRLTSDYTGIPPPVACGPFHSAYAPTAFAAPPRLYPPSAQQPYMQTIGQPSQYYVQRAVQQPESTQSHPVATPQLPTASGSFHPPIQGQYGRDQPPTNQGASR